MEALPPNLSPTSEPIPITTPSAADRAVPPPTDLTATGRTTSRPTEAIAISAHAGGPETDGLEHLG